LLVCGDGKDGACVLVCLPAYSHTYAAALCGNIYGNDEKAAQDKDTKEWHGRCRVLQQYPYFAQGCCLSTKWLGVTTVVVAVGLTFLLPSLSLFYLIPPAPTIPYTPSSRFIAFFSRSGGRQGIERSTQSDIPWKLGRTGLDWIGWFFYVYCFCLFSLPLPLARLD